MITDNTLGKYPEIGIGRTIGTSAVHWIGVINPVLSSISLIIGITVGIITLYLQIKKIRK